MENKQSQPFILVVPPFYSVARPNLAVSLLQSVLQQAGVCCRAEYANFRFAEMLGIQDFLTVADTLFPELLLGDWIFAEAAFADEAERDVDRYAKIIHQLLRKEGNKPPAKLKQWLLHARECANEFCRQEALYLASLQPQAVGFTIAVQQTVSAIGIARELKKLREVVTLAGGPNCEGVMGRQLWQVCEAFDYVCLGEGERVIVEAAEQIREHRIGAIAGCLTPFDREKNPIGSITKAAYTNLNQLPTPDFSDYFREIALFPYSIEPALVLESSRGCWWGVKSQCTFCGLSPETIAWREKDAQKTIAELKEITNTYGNYPVLMADLIFPHQYYSDFLPAMRQNTLPLRLFYEIKANISQDKMQGLYQAGIRWILPGIESLSSNALKLMKKGTTAAQNVAILKWAINYGLSVSWNFILGFPGEQDDWYQQLIPKIAALAHLQPPMSVGDIHLDRYSPLFSDPLLGAKRIGPCAAYSCVYPWPAEVLNNLACYFDMRPVDDGCRPLTKKLIKKAFRQWRNDWSSCQRPILEGQYNKQRTQIVITDTRKIAKDKQYRLPKTAVQLLQAVEKPLAWHQFEALITTTAAIKALKILEERHLLFHDDGHVISLVNFPDPDCLAEFTFGLPTGFVDTFCAEKTHLPIIRK